MYLESYFINNENLTFHLSNINEKHFVGCSKHPRKSEKKGIE